MKRIGSKEIKKIVLGVMVSDGYIDRCGRFDLYNKNEEYVLFIKDVLENITGVVCKIYRKHDPRFDVVGYRLTTNTHPYFKKMREIFYDTEGKKHLSEYVTSRLDFLALAHLWMCDGYMYHAKNKTKGSIQNIGYFCLEGFPANELEFLIEKLASMGINSRLEKVEWGFGNRIKLSAKDLQRYVDGIYPHILNCFLYKTLLYYKTRDYLDTNLQSAEHFVRTYDEVEDIVRHS